MPIGVVTVVIGVFKGIVGGVMVLTGIGAIVPDAVAPVDVIAVETWKDGNVGCSLDESMTSGTVAEDHAVVAVEALEPAREPSSCSG